MSSTGEGEGRPALIDRTTDDYDWSRVRIVEASVDVEVVWLTMSVSLIFFIIRIA